VYDIGLARVFTQTMIDRTLRCGLMVAFRGKFIYTIAGFICYIFIAAPSLLEKPTI
jgi:hypothetical protein